MVWTLLLALAAAIAAPATQPAATPVVYVLGGGPSPAGLVPQDARRWRLMTAGATVGEGGPGDGGRIDVPPVRGRLAGLLVVDGAETAEIVVLPSAARDVVAARSASLDVVVVEGKEADAMLAETLPTARRVGRPLALRMSRPDVVIVAADALVDVAPAEQLLLAQLAGAIVLILPQQAAEVVGRDTLDPADGVTLKWRDEPPAGRLLGTLRAVDLQPAGPLRLLDVDGATLVAAAEGAEDAEGDVPAAVVRQGNLILWQLPLDAARLTYLLAAVLDEAAAAKEIP